MSNSKPLSAKQDPRVLDCQSRSCGLNSRGAFLVQLERQELIVLTQDHRWLSSRPLAFVFCISFLVVLNLWSHVYLGPISLILLLLSSSFFKVYFVCLKVFVLFWGCLFVVVFEGRSCAYIVQTGLKLTTPNPPLVFLVLELQAYTTMPHCKRQGLPILPRLLSPTFWDKMVLLSCVWPRL